MNTKYTHNERTSSIILINYVTILWEFINSTCSLEVQVWGLTYFVVFSSCKETWNDNNVERKIFSKVTLNAPLRFSCATWAYVWMTGILLWSRIQFLSPWRNMQEGGGHMNLQLFLSSEVLFWEIKWTYETGVIFACFGPPSTIIILWLLYTCHMIQVTLFQG